ncbi:MAG TPA: DUF2163 domain-containing protein [Rhizobiales bacterium]|nr:hypothetical protein BMS3Bbin10_01598 [bacterium BMS3Bbin10]HDO51120.1 DUF2163 domain-containing protein [Hyphomicrobiales bacterium]
MRVLPAGLQEHLDTGTTTLCWCWRVIRADGVTLGFTDHDHDLIFDGTTFEAASGFSASDVESTVGLGVDNLDVESVLRSGTLNEDDLAAGLFDGAAVEIFRVNWGDTEQRVLIRAGHLGEVTRGRHSFRAEVRGLAHELQQPKGRLYQFGCDADLGDARCTVDLELAAFKGTGSVTQIDGARVLTVSGLDAFASDWFTRGLLTWTGGANAGRKMEIKLHTKADSTVTIELWQRMSQPIAVADAFTVSAGCDKQFITCRDKFNNAVNFRGFPHIPGNDFAVSYPNSDDPQNDGGSLFS